MNSKRICGRFFRRFDARYFAGLYDFGFYGRDTVRGNDGEG